VIRKYLIIGKQITLSSARFDVTRDDGVPPPIEIKMPVEVLWQAQEILKKAESLISAGEDTQTIKDTYSKLLRLLIPHTTSEKDRAWLLDQVQ
jgi:hypothetical protein